MPHPPSAQTDMTSSARHGRLGLAGHDAREPISSQPERVGPEMVVYSPAFMSHEAGGVKWCEARRRLNIRKPWRGV